MIKQFIFWTWWTGGFGAMWQMLLGPVLKLTECAFKAVSINPLFFYYCSSLMCLTLFQKSTMTELFFIFFSKMNNGSPMDGLSHQLLITVTYKLLSIKARIHWFVWLLDNHRNLRKIHIWQFFSKLSATNLWKVGRMFNVAIGKFCKYLTNLDMIAIREKINMN